MAQSIRCSSFLCSFPSQIRITVTLPCGHKVCQSCVLEEYQKEGFNQCPKRECKKISFIDPKSLIDQKDLQNESQKQGKQPQLEESKNEISLQQKPKQIKVQILTKNKEKINLIVEQGEIVE